MESEQSLAQPAGASGSGQIPRISTDAANMPAISSGTKRSASPSNGDPSKRARTDADSAGPDDENQQLENADCPNDGNGLPYEFPPLSPARMQELRLWLESHSNISRISSGTQTQLLKSMVPQHQDLEEICRTMGVETNGIDWKTGVHFPGIMADGLKAKPHQIIGTVFNLKTCDISLTFDISGADWICNTLNSPLRAGLLSDESGTGKTVQIGLALAFHYYRMKAEVQAGKFKPRDEERHFKPSLYECPPDIAYQTFREWKHWFPDFFDIQICHGKKSTTPDPSIRNHVIDDYQGWVDENAEAHENIEASNECGLPSRIIAIVPFKTAVTRFLHPEEKVNKPKRNRNGAPNKTTGEVEGGTSNLNEGRSEQRVQPKRRQKRRTKKTEIKFKITGQRYNWVICDDVPAIRGPRPKTHKLIQQLDDEATLVTSSTPLLNRQEDM
ncbi:hypothetical protein IL306_007341 [Fusarium sp. DS 682]|nr:hypothetical protein IL306_007341 [Fusarium sp. DS 682]